MAEAETIHPGIDLQVGVDRRGARLPLAGGRPGRSGDDAGKLQAFIGRQAPKRVDAERAAADEDGPDPPASRSSGHTWTATPGRTR